MYTVLESVLPSSRIKSHAIRVRHFWIRADDTSGEIFRVERSPGWLLMIRLCRARTSVHSLRSSHDFVRWIYTWPPPSVSNKIIVDSTWRSYLSQMTTVQTVVDKIAHRHAWIGKCVQCRRCRRVDCWPEFDLETIRIGVLVKYY